MLGEPASPVAPGSAWQQADVALPDPGLTNDCSDLLGEGSFLQFKSTPGICYFSICHELDIQHFLLALCLLQRENGEQSSRVCSWSKTLLWEAEHSPALTRMPASRSASATPMSASLRTAAV